MDAIDKKIIAILRRSGRISNADLAKAVALSPSACLRRVRLLEENGTIRGYTALINERPNATDTVVIVQISLERQTDEYLRRFEKAAIEHPDIRECYMMTGPSDYLLRVTVSDTSSYERIHTEVLSRLPGVSRIDSSFAIRTVIKPPDL